MSEKELVEELLSIAEVTQGNEIEFTDRAKEIIKELAERYKQLPIEEQAKNQMPDWIKTATATDIYLQMCERIISAPSVLHIICVPKILIPILWKKIQAEEG